MAEPTGAIVGGFLGLALLGIVPRAGESCPPDHPHLRTVTEHPTVLNRSVPACVPRLACPQGSDQCERTPAAECPPITRNPAPVTYPLCLSDDELKQTR